MRFSNVQVVWGLHLAEVRGVVSSIIWSTCSRVRPLVSGLNSECQQLIGGKKGANSHEEVCVDKGSSAKTTPDEEDGRLEVALVSADHVGSDDGDDSVPQPV